MPDPKEWTKIAENIVKTRNWLYQLLDDETIHPDIETTIHQIRYLLVLALTEIDILAERDGKGWL